MNDLLENAKRNSKITLEEFFFEFYSKILEFEQETKIKENENIYITKNEGMYSDFLPVSYPPQVYQSWGQNANYYLAKEEEDPILINPELTYFIFIAICGIEGWYRSTWNG